jgi:hypothetical protein
MGLLAYLRDTGTADAPSLPAKVKSVGGREFVRYQIIARAPPRPLLCCIPIFHPMSRFAVAWGLIATLVDLTYTAIFVPLSLAFSTYSTDNVFIEIDFIGSE